MPNRRPLTQGLMARRSAVGRADHWQHDEGSGDGGSTTGFDVLLTTNGEILPGIRAGDEIHIVTNGDHEVISIGWLRLAKGETGALIKRFRKCIAIACSELADLRCAFDPSHQMALR
jgi:selenocysteine lyase/cysteine desulfurase